MMVVFYSFSILIVRTLYHLASLFNIKAKAFVSGRKDLYTRLEQAFHTNTSPVIWVHCASLGEFEQGRPVIEKLKSEFPHHKLLLTFFSPSGYEVRKKYSHADYVTYLPWDTARNAHRFVERTKPVLAIFVKYEFWYHYSRALHQKHIPLISISAIFRPEQVFFKSYGNFYQSILKYFSWFFVQNDESVRLLKSIGIDDVSHAGDTRFDRVHQLVMQSEELDIAKAFKNTEKVMVIGSSWPEDIDILLPFINEQAQNLKFIIAPHEIHPSALDELEKAIGARTIRYTNASGNLEEYRVLLVDTIGVLGRLYRYGEFAYVGGAFGKGLHNILEAACYGIPVFFGNKNYVRFKEATDLINRGGAFAIGSYHELRTAYEQITIPQNFLLACDVTSAYVQENLGATEKIMAYCRPLLTKS